MKVYSKIDGALRITPEAHTRALQRGVSIHELASATQKNLKPGRLHEAVDKIVRQNMGVGSEEARIVPLALSADSGKIYLVFVEPKNA